jgi:cytidylate kinase
MDRAPRATATAVLDHALAQRPLLGGGRLVCIDGPSGSGKSTLAAAVAGLAENRGLTAHVLHADDLLQGWTGLPALGPRLRNDVVGPLASGHPARYRRYDWEAEAFAEEHVVAPMDLLVLDGCGSGHPALASRRATLVWVEADDDLRLARALARDGDAVREPLLRWWADEARLFERYGIREQADFHADATGRLVDPPPLGWSHAPSHR